MPAAKTRSRLLTPPSEILPHQISVPLLDFKRQYATIRKEVLAAIARICDSQKFILGPEVEALEDEIATLTGAKAAVGCGSGTDALWLAIAGAGVKPGDRVVTTAFSFFASASSVVRAGAEPVFVDVDPATLNLDAKQVQLALQKASSHHASAIRRKKVEPRRIGRASAFGPTGAPQLTALLPVHVYGQCADMTAFQKIAEEHDLAIIEDAAQAIGAQWRGRDAGSMGTTAAFSFYPTKNVSAFGEAGIVTTHDEKIAEHMRRLRNHGSPERYLHTEFGWNARLDAIQAAILRVKLKHIKEWNQQRRERAATYDRLLAAAGFGNAMQAGIKLSQRDPLRRLNVRVEAQHVFHQYVLRAWRRDDLRKFLAARGIGSEVYYPIPLHLQPVFAYLGYKRGDLPESERAAHEVLALPIFPELTEEEQKAVVRGIAEFYS